MKARLFSLLLGILLITSCDNRIPYFEKTIYRFDNQEQKAVLYTKDIIYTVSVYENEEPVATDVVLPEGKSDSISGSWYTVSFSHDNRQQVGTKRESFRLRTKHPYINNGNKRLRRWLPRLPKQVEQSRTQ